MAYSVMAKQLAYILSIGLIQGIVFAANDSADNFCNQLEAQNALVALIKDSNYQKDRQPTAPVIMNASFVINDILQIDEMARTAKIMMTLYQMWDDPRLQLPLSQCPRNLSIPVPDTLLGSLWLPGFRITTARDAVVIRAPSAVSVITVNPNGNVTYRTNMVLTLNCGADYTAYPFDAISCSMVAGTWVSESFLKVQWIDDQPVKLVSFRIKLSSFAVGKYDYQDASNPMVGGRYVISIKLHRYYAYYILNVYVPNALVVLLAWSSFWLAPDGGRGGLCISMLVSIVLMFNGVADSLPKVGYLKGIDIWFIICIILICVAFLEYAFLAYLQLYAGGLDAEMPFWTSKKEYLVRDFAALLDRISRVLFALAFILFVIIYFAVYVRPIPQNYEQSGVDMENV